MNTEQIEMVSVEQLVPEKHTYRKLKKLLDFVRITKSVKVKESSVPYSSVAYTVRNTTY